MQSKIVNLFQLALCCSVLSMGFTACSTGKTEIVADHFDTTHFPNNTLAWGFKNYKNFENMVYKFGIKGNKLFDDLIIQSIQVEEDKKLKIDIEGKKYTIYYKIGAPDWREFYTFTDGEYLSTRVAGGFVGTTIGMYATSSGSPSNINAIFHNFIYTGNNELLGIF